jgi:UDP-N-acetylglucosamine--N-acetylmuramyl-(pentapeptide) pyrophosphoryl-undecaprenol N-acetylglucosamine transferase
MLERKMVESRGFEFLSLPSLKFSGSALAVPRWVARSAGGLLAAHRLIQQVRPHIVVSLGGYAALAPSLAAALSDVPLAAMEQNAIPGKTSRLLSWWAREVYAPWPGIEKHFSYPERVFVTGNPVRPDIQRRRNAALAAEFGLSPQKRTLLVMGGSQGAQFLNRTVAEALPLLEEHAPWLQILHSAGQIGYQECRAAYAKSGVQASVHPFIEDMGSAYALSDLAFCRAGGTSLAELTAVGLPAVLVPLPIAANDHQRKNASHVAGAGAGFLVDQADLTGARLAAIAVSLLQNDECMARMRANSLRLGRPAATQNIVDRLLKLLPVGLIPGAERFAVASVVDGD